MKIWWCAIVLLLGSGSVAAQDRAFPGAEGGGAGASGGRGGDICKVTSLANSGAGTFRNCVEGSWANPRTVIFDIGGTIAPTTPITITDGSGLTVACQTAPGDGIQISGNSVTGSIQGLINLRASNVIMRYCAIRVGNSGSWGDNEGDAISIDSSAVGPITDIILSEMSLFWGRDENIEVYSNSATNFASEVTIQNSIIAENLTSSGSGLVLNANTNATGRAAMNEIDFIRNYMLHAEDRVPLTYHTDTIVANNIIYNWGFGVGTNVGGGSSLDADVLANLFKGGPDSDGGSNPDDLQWLPDCASNCTGTGDPSLYVEDNVFTVSGNRVDPADDWAFHFEGWGSGPGEFSMAPEKAAFNRGTPLSRTFAVTLLDADTLDTALLDTSAEGTAGILGAYRSLNCDGTWRDTQDAADARVVADWWETGGAIIADEDTVGGFPTYTGGTACTDTDGDGMPATWEVANGLSDSDAADRNATDLAESDALVDDHYTNLEVFLNGIEIASEVFCGLFTDDAGGVMPSPLVHPVDGTYGQKIHVDCVTDTIIVGSCSDPTVGTAASCNDDLFFAPTASLRVTGAGQEPRWVERNLVCGRETGVDNPPNECPAGTGEVSGWIGTRATIDISQSTLVAAGVIPSGANVYDHVHLVRLRYCVDSNANGACENDEALYTAQAFEP